MEQFANNCQALVASGGYTSGSGVLNVNSTAAPFPQVGDFRISIFNKDDGGLKVILKVTAVNSATQFAVTAEGPDANADEDDIVLGTMVTAAIMSSIPRWVFRDDPDAVDFDIGDFTADNAYRDLDLSSIVPTGAKFVLISLRANPGTSGGRTIHLRKNGNANDVGTLMMNFDGEWRFKSCQCTVPCDANRVIEYKISASLNTIEIVVLGWYLDTLN